ncbi:MAG: PAS domain S-box protein [Bellilinea sp.]
MTKILIVDDEEKNLYLLQVLLTANGYELVSAANGAEALELAHQAAPDVIISDILMPVMDGFSFCRACKQDERLRDIPFIFYTATYTEPQDEALALSLGAERFIIKPTEPAEFLALLKETIEKHATSSPVARHGVIEDAEYYKEHSAALIRKLEDKVAELEEKNREVKADNEARKKAEEALKESEVRFKYAFEYAPIGKALVAPDGRFLKINRSLTNILGYSEDELLKKTYQEITHPDDLDIQQTYTQQLLAGEIQSYQTEKRYFHKNGRIINVQLDVSLVRDKNEQPLYFVSQVQDITVGERMEEELRHSNDLLNVTGQIAKVGGWEIHPDTQTLNWTEEVYRIHEVDLATRPNPAEAINFYAPEARPVISAAIQACIESGTPWDLELELITAKGNRIWVHTQGNAERRDSKITRIYGAFQDITERKLAENEIRKANVLLNITGRIAQVGGWEYDFEKDELLGTEGLYRILEVDPSTHLRLSDRINFYAPEFHPAISEALQNCLDHGTPINLEVPLITAKGNQKWVSFHGQAENAGGKTARLFGAFQDITERKLAEKKLRESEERYRLISTVTSDYMFSSQIGADGKLSLNWVAGAFEEITGYSFEEFVARGGWRATLHPDDLAVDDRDMEKLRAGQSINSEIRTITKSGKTVWVRVYAHPVVDAKSNELVGIYGAVQNITARKQDEELIHQRTQDLQLINAISSAINQGMEIKDIITFVSKELLDIFHCDVVVVAQPGPDPNFLLVEHVEFTSTLFKKVEKMIGGNRKSLNVKMPITGDGQFARILKRAEIEMINDPATIRAMMVEYGENEIQRRLISQASKVLGFRSVIPVPLVTNGRTYGLLQIGHSAQFPESSVKRIRVIAAQMTAAIARKHAEQQTIQRLQNIEALHTIDTAIANSMDLSLTLKVVAEETIRQMGVDAADILLYNPASNLLETNVFQGFRTAAMQKVSLRIGQGLAGQISSIWEQIFIPDLADYSRKGAHTSLFAGEDFVTYCGMPLLAKGQFIGVLEVFNRTRLNPDQDWFNFLETLAGQAAIAIDSINSFNEIQIANTKLILAYDATIEGWSRAMDLRDEETEGHTQRVTDLTLQLARKMGITDDQLIHIRRGALLHDMGKLGIPDQILLKPGKLTDEEWVIMRKHPVYAYEMLSSIEYLRPALDIPYCHHEKWDGSGYPRGLKGEEIPLAARIFAVIDVWDALTSDRPYRKAWSREQTLEYIREQSGSHFDPQIVEVFLANMDLR